MKTILNAAVAAALLAGPALAQGLQPSGTRAGGPGQLGAPGEILPGERSYLRGYVVREAVPPVVVEGRVGRGTAVPSGVELRDFPDAVYGEAPSVRGYLYFSTGRNVVLVDPRTREVIDVIED